MQNKNYSDLTYKNGLKDGLPIGLGYFPVSFAFGVKASILQMPVLLSLLISMTNLTSAGQLAGLDIVAVCGSFIEVILTQLLINSRYFLMSLSLAQKTDDSFTLPTRFLISTFITDEIFAVAVAKPYNIGKKYMLGLATIPYIGWTLGTLFGALAGDILPIVITSALGIALYAMFIAIIIPPATKSLSIAIVTVISASLSCALYYIPIFDFISVGFKIIICALASASIVAYFFPLKKEVTNERNA